MAELIIANGIKRALKEWYGLNFTLLQFGTHAAARRAEMAHADPADYLGLRQPGGPIDKDISSILARMSGMPSATLTGTAAAAAAATQAAAETLKGVARAEKMSFWKFVKSLVLVGPSILFDIVWNFAVNLLTLIYRTALLVSVGTILFYVFQQGLAFRPAFEQVQRRLRYEDIDQQYAIGNAISDLLRGLPRLIGWIIIAPFIAVAAGYRFIRDSAGWRGLRDLCRQGNEAASEWLFGWYLRLRYNWFFDTLTLHYYLITNWFNRNALRIFWAGLAGVLLWRLYSVGPGTDDEIIRFGSWAEMAAYYGVPQDHFPHERGGAFNAKPWLRREIGDLPIAAGEDVEVTWLDSVEQTRWEAGEGAEVTVPMADESEEIVQSLPDGEQVASAVPASAGSVPKRVIADGRVEYCRKCRQRHCCEAVDEEPEMRVLFPEQ